MQLLKLILWPLDESLDSKVLSFETGKVNFIVGPSNTGKSSIWPIIDYCLGSRELRVPIGFPKEKVSWFGIHILVEAKQYLIARKSNLVDNQRSEWFFSEDEPITLPVRPNKNIRSKDFIKDHFSQSFSRYLEQLDATYLTELQDDNFGSFSYRDLLSLNHQVQYALVNPSSLFIREADDISVIKLKKLLPNILFNYQGGNLRAMHSMVKSLEDQGAVIKSEILFLEKEVISLYKEAAAKKMVVGYVEPRPDWPTSKLVGLIDKVLQDYREVYRRKLNENNLRFDQRTLDEILIIGRIQQCLKFFSIVDRYKKIEDESYSLKEEIRTIRLRYEKPAKYSPQNQLSALIHAYATEMNLGHLDLTPYFDEMDATLKFKSALESNITLAKLGNVTNFIGYNIAAFLAFHEMLVERDCDFVNRFIVIDQPSQGFSTNSADESDKLQQLFRTLEQAVEKMNGGFQIIVFEQIMPRNSEANNKYSAVQNWNINGEALVPQNW